jgi:hypothetical protein
MLDASTKSARSVATAAVLVCAVVHSTMNFKFGLSLSHDPVERYIFAVFGVAIDVTKVFALAFVAYAWDHGRRVKAIMCLVVWATTVTYSTTAAIGFAALARDSVVAVRSSDVNDYKANIAEQKRLSEQMEAARANPLFTESYGCTEYNKNATKGVARKTAELCSGYWRAANATDELKPQVRSASLTDADPQTALLAKITGQSRETVAIGLAVFLAAVAEIVSALGTWTFSASRRKPERRQPKEGGKLKSITPPLQSDVRDVLQFNKKRPTTAPLH